MKRYDVLVWNGDGGMVEDSTGDYVEHEEILDILERIYQAASCRNVDKVIRIVEHELGKGIEID